MKARSCHLHRWCPPSCREYRTRARILADLNGDPAPMPRWWWVLCMCLVGLALWVTIVLIAVPDR